MEKCSPKIINTYLTSEQEVIGYDAWVCWYTRKGIDRLACANLVEKDNKLVSASSDVADFKDIDKQSCMIEDIIDILKLCVDADIITIHVSDFRIVRMLEFGFVPKRLLNLVARYKKLVGKTEVIFVKDKWYEIDHHNNDVERRAKEKFNGLD